VILAFLKFKRNIILETMKSKIRNCGIRIGWHPGSGHGT